MHTNGKCQYQQRGGLAPLVAPRSPASAGSCPCWHSDTYLLYVCYRNQKVNTLTNCVTSKTFPWIDTQQCRGLQCSRTSRCVFKGRLLVLLSNISKRAMHQTSALSPESVFKSSHDQCTTCTGPSGRTYSRSGWVARPKQINHRNDGMCILSNNSCL